MASAHINTNRAEITSPAIQNLRLDFMSGISITCIKLQFYRHGFMSNDKNVERFYEYFMCGTPENRGCVFYAQARLDFVFFMSGAGKLYE